MIVPIALGPWFTIGRQFYFFGLVVLAAQLTFAGDSAASAASAARPNILLILADDLGYSDLGCYGGEIETPNLDRLAAGGLRFTQFYNTARCWPSRAALLTGYYAQQVGRDEIPGAGGGAAGKRPAWAPLLPRFLESAGYRSYHSGKWHVDGMPLENGFDRSYLVLDQDRYFSPRVHYEDDQKLPAVEPGTSYYATVAIADHAIKCLRGHAQDHPELPFFQYLAFTCPHFPLQALEEDIARYRGRFAAGWDALRAERLARMRKMGLVSCELSPRTPGVPAWDSLTQADRETWQRRVEIHAAMVDRMDREIGRVLGQLQSSGALENTIVFFMSDNGASAERVLRGDGHDADAPQGSAKTFQCLEPPWANLANAPLRRSKIFVHEGGISTPLIVRWPRGIAARGQLRHQPAHLIDLVPTILELADTVKPDRWQDRDVPPAPGRSLLKALKENDAVSRDYLWWFHSGNRALRRGDWKLVSEGDGAWELYDLGSDRGESKNLATDQAQRVAQMSRFWEERLAEFRETRESGR
jgi:arylsulfatase A-like enzyme